MWLDIEDLHYAIFVINSVASFARSHLKASALNNVAKIIKREVLI